MQRLFILFTCLWLWASTASAASELGMLRRSVFKIRTTSVSPDYRRPWKHFASQSSYGSGFYIGNGRILTNAHVVANQRFVTVQKDGDPAPYIAKVLFVGDDTDLAVLTVEDKEYFKGLATLSFGPLPRLLSPVEAVGYPRGGEQISITEGVVSRISYRVYAHTGHNQHVLIQVDSPINPGNSGGPVIQNGKVVGVAFQGVSDAQSTGYMIPVPVIQRFLADIKDNKYDGSPQDGIVTQGWGLVNPDARSFHGLSPRSSEGSLVSFVDPSSFLFETLKAGDIILSVDNHPVGLDDKVEWERERVDFRALIDFKLPGDKLQFVVLRDQKKIPLTTTFTKNPPSYDPGKEFLRFPQFYTYGGMIFSTLSLNYLQTWGQKWYYQSPVVLRYLNDYFPLRPLSGLTNEVVILIGRLPNEVNSFVSTPLNSIVKSVNGKSVATIADLKAAIDGVTEEFVTISYHMWADDTVFVKAEADKAQPEIITKYQIKPEDWLQHAQ